MHKYAKILIYKVQNLKQKNFKSIYNLKTLTSNYFQREQDNSPLQLPPRTVAPLGQLPPKTIAPGHSPQGKLPPDNCTWTISS